MGKRFQYGFLRNHELFIGLNNEEIKELLQFSKYITLKKDNFIYISEQQPDHLYMLCEGRIKIAYSTKNNDAVLSEILKEGDIFGQLALTRAANTCGEFAQVLTGEATMYSFNTILFEQFMEKRSAMSFIFAKILGQKLMIISAKYCDLVFKNARERVVNFFMLHAQYEGKWAGNQAEIKTFCTHQDIANFTASSRQTVSTIINQLVKEKKIIYEGRSKLIIPDVKKLKT